MPRYAVHRNRDGLRLEQRDGLGWDAAIARAAVLARVAPRTIKRRIIGGPIIDGAYEVSGVETGSDGVWIEQER